MYDTIVYVYPQWHVVSFTYVAKAHIQALREAGYKVIELDERKLDSNQHFDFPVIIHPFFFNKDRIPKAPIVIGVDVIETTCVSRSIYDALSKVDFLIVPSKFSKYVLEKLGYNNVFVVPHFMPKEFDRPVRNPNNPLLKWIQKCKLKEGWLGILYHIPHSGLRKGALEAFEIFHALRLKYDSRKFKPILKRVDIKDYLLGALWTLDCIDIEGRFDIHDYIDVIDISDAHLCVSRAGGFEIPALESIYRGVPTFAPVCGCFSEYAHLITVPLGCTYHPCHYDKFNMHVGFGWRVDIEDAVMKLSWFIEDPKPFKELALKRMEDARREFNFEIGSKRFVEVIDRILKVSGK